MRPDINYAVMEHADSAVVVPFTAGRSDVGAWSSLWQVCPRDAKGNVIRGDVIAEDTENSLLVAHKDKAQEVRVIVNQLKASDRIEYKVHRCVYRMRIDLHPHRRNPPSLKPWQHPARGYRDPVWQLPW